MIRTDIAVIGLRLFALWLGCRAALAIGESLELMRVYPSESNGKYVVLTLPALLILAAAAVWMADRRLARLLLPRVEPSEVVSRWTVDDAQRVVLVGVGAYLAAVSMSSLGYWAYFLPQSLQNPTFAATPSMIASVIRATVGFVVGLLLIFGAGGMLRLIRFARRAGGRRDATSV